MAAMEALLVRIDHFHDRRLYVSTLKSWLEALGGADGRLVSVGDVHLLFVEAPPARNDALLAQFASAPVDTNAKGEPCVDRFIDVVGRKPIDKAVCKGFLEMNVLNATLLERLLVGDWHCEKQWLADALSTPRTKALIQWREEAKNARKDRRKRAAQDRDAERAAKRAKAEEDKARAEAERLAKEAAGDGDDDEGENEDEKDTKEEAEDDASGDEASVLPSPAPKAKSAPAVAPPAKQAHPNKPKPNAKGPAPPGNAQRQQSQPAKKHHHHHHSKPSGSRPANGKKHHPKKA